MTGLRPLRELIAPLSAETLARDVADFLRVLELTLLRHRDNIAALTGVLLHLDLDPGTMLLQANRELGLIRQMDPDALIDAYLETPEATRVRFTEAGRLDREDAERVTSATVEMLAASQENERRCS